MAKKVKFPVQKDDIPAWFMTYSDVITLLMTFFILLLTFSTNSPERFEKSQKTKFKTGGAPGLIGKTFEKPTKDSWVNRVRPNSARIAMRGAEMPPIKEAPATETFGQGLKSLEPEDRNHNEMTSHYFDVELNRIFDSNNELTSQGQQICRTLSTQLRDLPFQASLQFSDASDANRIVKIMTYLFKEQQTRPGQVSMNRIRNASLPPQKLRIVIKRYLGNAS